MRTMTLLQAIREFLMLPGEALGQLRDQYSKLTDKDKADLREYFKAIDVEISDPAKS